MNFNEIGLNKIVYIIVTVLFIFSAGHLQASDIDGLVQDINDDNLIVRLKAVKELGESGDVRAVHPLIDSLGDRDCGHTAANALVKLVKKGQPSVEPLIITLKDENPFVRRNAVYALGEIKDVRAVNPLIDALKDNDLIVRRNAAKALGKIRDTSAVEPLTAALNDECPVVRRSAATALKEMGKLKPKVVDILY